MTSNPSALTMLDYATLIGPSSNLACLSNSMIHAQSDAASNARPSRSRVDPIHPPLPAHGSPSLEETSSPLELAHALVKHPLLIIHHHDAVFEGALPLVFDSLDLVIGTEDRVATIVFVFAGWILAIVI